MFNRGLEGALRILRNSGRLEDKKMVGDVNLLPKLRGDNLKLQERVSEVTHFSREQRKKLERKGYIVYSLTGQTIASLRDTGHQFWSTWHIGEPIEQYKSMLTEVAIKPKNLFLPNSTSKTLDEQIATVEHFGKKIGDEVKSVTAILGSVPDYAELAFLHLAITGKRLFGSDYGYDYTRTTTPTDGPFVAVVGAFNADYGLRIYDRDGDSRFDYIWASPLVVPTTAIGR